MDPLISVIVAAYNVGPWIGRCVDSILAQTYQNLEVILIDDGSADDTCRIIDDYAAADRRIRAVHQTNEGLVAVREKGIRLASGQYAAFVDGDDAVTPDMYARLLKNAQQYQADISHCGIRFCFPDGHGEPHYGTGNIVIQNHFAGIRDLLEGTFVEPTLCNKLYKTRLLRNSCLDPTVLNNEDLLRNFVLFSRSHKSVFEDFCGYQYFQRQGSMSKDPTTAVASCRHIYRARRLILEHASPKIYPYAMRSWLSCIVNFINTLADSSDPQCLAYCRECREILWKERKNLHYLIRRQQINAGLILFSPALHRKIYRAYYNRKYGRGEVHE